MNQKDKQNINSFLKDYKVAAIASSSKFLVKEVLKEIPDNLNIIIEHGSGDGVLSKHLLKKVKTDGKVFLVEQNQKFLDILNKIKNPQAHVFSGYAQDFDYKKNLGENKKVDLVVSSIPFFFLSEKDREDVVREAYKNLKSGGKLIVFHQYRLYVLPYLKKYFKDIKLKFVLRNLFPCFIIIATK